MPRAKRHVPRGLREGYRANATDDRGHFEGGTIENPRRLKKIAEVLGVTEAYLRFGEEPSREDEERFTEAQFLVEQFLITHRKSISLRDKFLVVSRLYLHMKRCNQVTASEDDVKRAFMDI